MVQQKIFTGGDSGLEQYEHQLCSDKSRSSFTTIVDTYNHYYTQIYVVKYHPTTPYFSPPVDATPTTPIQSLLVHFPNDEAN